jgi:hypothetical protein
MEEKIDLQANIRLEFSWIDGTLSRLTLLSGNGPIRRQLPVDCWDPAAPNERWLTDITEFQIPAGNVLTLYPDFEPFGCREAGMITTDPHKTATTTRPLIFPSKSSRAVRIASSSEMFRAIEAIVPSSISLASASHAA